MMKKKNKKEIPVFGQRVETDIQDQVRKFCKERGFSLQGFFKNALLHEMEYQRTGRILR